MHPANLQCQSSLEQRAVKGLIFARIASNAALAGAHVAVVADAKELSYADLERSSNQLAAFLQNLGVLPGACVALLLERSADFVVAALAVMKAGAAYLPLDSSTPAERVKLIVQDSGAAVLLTHRGKEGFDAGEKCRIVDMSDIDVDHLRASEVCELGLTASQGDLGYVIYTSGSTGTPKGVEITHANLMNLVDWHNDAFELRSTDRASQVAGLGFDAAGWEIWPALAAGASVHFTDEVTRRSPQALRDWIVSERITVSFVPTVLAEQLLHTPWPPETALRALLTGADTLHRRPIAGLPFKFVNNYGPTECTVVATSGVVEPDTQSGSQPSIGRAIANTCAWILDDHLNPVAAGEPGELCLAGAHVGRGYRNNAQLTAAKFVMFTPPGGSPVRIYRTGDRAKMLPNGEIAFLGRVDEQVKIRGYRVELGEIVASLDRIPGVEASAVAVRSNSTSPTLVAYLISTPSSRLTASDVREFLAARLPDYMVPAQFVAIESLPMTANGKLDRSALPAQTPENQLPSGGQTTTAASTGKADAEQSIATMVASLLGQPTVGRDDNFFMLGGHSMLGAQLVARIRDAFGVKLTLRQLFGAPTVAALAAEVARLAQATVNSGL